MEVTVVVATFGDPEWRQIARRAIASAEALDVPVIHVHSTTLHAARNRALDRVGTEWVCHLDADDELEPRYFEAMRLGSADVRAPSVRYVRRSHDRRPARMPRVAGHSHRCSAPCLVAGNWLVVGSVARTELLRSVGGWRDFDWSEDWDLWVRCHLAGASIEAIPAAVYRAYVRRDSRNRAPAPEDRVAAHNAIAAANGLVPV